MNAYSVFLDLEGPEFPAFDAPLLDQVDAIIRHHKRCTDEDLDPREAIGFLDRLRADYRAARPTTGFGLTCPYCFGTEESLVLDVNDPTKVQCLRCLESTTPEKAHAELAEMLEAWGRLLEWMRQGRLATARA